MKKILTELIIAKTVIFYMKIQKILIWTNDKTAKVNHMLGTDDDFILTDYS